MSPTSRAGRSGVKKMGLTGLVYGSVKGVTRLAGGTVNALLSGRQLAGLLGQLLQAGRNPWKS